MEKNIKEMIEYPKEGILSKELIRNSKVDIGLFCMTKGTNMSEHTSVRPAYVQVIEGNGIFNLEGKDISMKEGVIIPMKAEAIHSIKAIEDTTFILGLY